MEEKLGNRFLFTNNKSGAADLIMDPTNPNKIIAAMWEHKRDPWFFKSGGEGSGLYITHDGGENWKKNHRKRRFTKRGTRKNWCGHSPQQSRSYLCLGRSEKKRTL